MKSKPLFCLILALSLGVSSPPSNGQDSFLDYRHPRPAGYSEPDAPAAERKLTFHPLGKKASRFYDLTAAFPKGSAPEFQVERVELNGEQVEEYIVENAGIFNGNRRVHGIEDFSISLEGGWRLAKAYEVKVTGSDGGGSPVEVAVAAESPESPNTAPGLGFGTPNPEDPYHHAILSIPQAAVVEGRVVRAEFDGNERRNFRVHHTGWEVGERGREQIRREDYRFGLNPDLAAQILVACNWTNQTEHTLRVTVETEDGGEKTYEATAKAPGKGGYWNAEWPHFVSLTVRETVGMLRRAEPIVATIGVFDDTIGDPAKELRVVVYDPTHPDAGDDGWVIAPSQVLSTERWADEEILSIEEIDSQTGQKVHRYDPTATVEFVFAADVLPYEEKVYLVLYGNPDAQALETGTEFVITPGAGLGQTVATASYEIGLATNSGAVETVTILGEGDPVLLEHRLETNGAVHWNPGCYTPPIPWVHASDWENPELEEWTGPVLHRRRAYAPLPHMTTVAANVAYEFYSKQPYIVQTSVMEVLEDVFVQAMRNGEIVFNHAVLNEFVWKDPLGVVQSLDIETSREHPVHALDIDARTEWMAFVNREVGVGFASINLEFQNMNRFGDLASQAQPYYYVQNGPWIYWSRGLVYPFGTNNLTRMMHVRKGGLYYEKNAWVPFRLGKGEPFALLEETSRKLRNPLLVHEWMGTDARTPRAWVVPILTMPFDEGVEGALGGHSHSEEN